MEPWCACVLICMDGPPCLNVMQARLLGTIFFFFFFHIDYAIHDRDLCLYLPGN